MRSIISLLTHKEVEVVVQWLELILASEAASALVLSSLNCLYFGRYAFFSSRPARRVGASALVVVNVALAAEAGSYLALTAAADGIALLIAVGLRTLLLAAAGFLSLLIWRQGFRARF
jgi:hypothetical protein